MADRSYRQSAPLTYQSAEKLATGSIVEVNLKNKAVQAIVIKQVARPSFKCQDITKIPGLALPPDLLKLLEWLRKYYSSPIGPVCQLALAASSSAKESEPVKTEPLTSTASIPLNKEQQKAVSTMSGPGTFLLHGRTGSGKTHVYAKLARQTLEAGKSVIILNPEIGLTSQLADKVQRLVGQTPILWHSELTATQRRRNWLEVIRATSPRLIVGARSALFAPLKEVGLIVVDECHENAYKQDQQPRYHALRVAAKLAELHQATLVLGSATPAITDYFLAQQRNRPIINLNQLAMQNSQKAKINLIDIKERDNFTKSAHLSDQLINVIKQALSDSQQAMVYLNRRGTARLSMCRRCGWRAVCPNCDLPMVYHGDSHKLICHTCGKVLPAKTSCPDCGNQDIEFKSAGTKAIEAELKKLFPSANIARFDSDNLKSDRLEQNYAKLKSGEIDIIIGTQMIAKGLDLPKLSTLGVVLADSSLSLPDFSSTERTFQLINQVIGRVNRGHQANPQIIVQTYSPDNYAIKDGLTGKWNDFYAKEIDERRLYGFPPFYHFLKVTCQRTSPDKAKKACQDTKVMLAKTIQSLSIDGPIPSFHEKSGGKYNWQIVIKSKSRSDLIKAIGLLPSSGLTYDIDPINLL